MEEVTPFPWLNLDLIHLDDPRADTVLIGWWESDFSNRGTEKSLGLQLYLLAWTLDCQNLGLAINLARLLDKRAAPQSRMNVIPPN